MIILINHNVEEIRYWREVLEQHSCFKCLILAISNHNYSSSILIYKKRYLKIINIQ